MIAILWSMHLYIHLIITCSVYVNMCLLVCECVFVHLYLQIACMHMWVPTVQLYLTELLILLVPIWWTFSKLMLSDDVIKVVGYLQYHNSHTALQIWSTSSVYNAVWQVCWMTTVQNATAMLWHSVSYLECSNFNSITLFCFEIQCSEHQL